MQCFVLFIIFILTYSLSEGNLLKQKIKSHKNLSLLPPRKKCGVQSYSDKIFGGKLAALDEFPWLVLLEYGKNGKSTGHQCGGSLVSDRYVLTAAHCVTGTVNSIFGKIVRVRLGEYDRSMENDCIIDHMFDMSDCSDPPVNIKVESIIPHPHYDDNDVNMFNDIALIRLAEKVNFTSFISPICLPLDNEITLPGNNLTVSGWGTTESGFASQVKLKVKLPVVSNKECAKIMAPDFSLRNSQLCAGGRKGIDSCSGDSGGPLMRSFDNGPDYFVEGIVSYGAADCGEAGVPGVYTRVTEFIQWILDNIKP